MKHKYVYPIFHSGAVAALLFLSASAGAYDGQNCSAPGVCWEAKPGFPANTVGSKYDPKHDPAEVAKQGNSITQMEARNKQRSDYFKKTGKFVYDVDKIPQS
jgi:methanol dehydrogenase (cytochrome c) subunit 2